MRMGLIGAVALALVAGLAQPAVAFDCNNSFAAAEAAIAEATKAMSGISDKTRMGLVHTLIDDADIG